MSESGSVSGSAEAGEKLAFGTKLEDFMVPELDFQCFANAAGQVCQLNFGDTA